MAYRAGGLSTFSDNGLALPARPSSSQKKKGKSPSFIRKSITIPKVRKKQANSGLDDRMLQLLYSYRAELRPLLDAIRFVESSNREDCPDGDGGASIGPLQISEHYHFDAWHSKRSFSWLSCRDLDHAENTVVAYWMRYCADALSAQDWEVLAKIHNGGPQGPQREKTAYYWSKVVKHLEEQGKLPAPKASQVAQTEGTGWRPALRCSSFTYLDRKMDEKLRNAGLKMFAPERHKPIINKRRKPRRLPLADISSLLNVVSPVSAELSTARLGKLDIHHLGLNCSFLDARGSDETGQAVEQKDGAADRFEATLDSPSAPALRDEQEETYLGNTPQSSSLDNTASSIPANNNTAVLLDAGSPIEGIVRAEAYRSSHEYWRSPESFGPRLQEGSLMMLYSADVSAQTQEEILTELAELLPPNLCDSKKSFEFPRTTSETELATPVMTRVTPDARFAHNNEASFKSTLNFDASEPEAKPDDEPSLSTTAEEELLAEIAGLLREEGVERESAEPLNLADFLLEIPEVSTSVEYAKALFSCEDVLLDRLCETAAESVGSSKPTEYEQLLAEMEQAAKPSFPICSCHCKGETMSSSSLKRLCAAWEEFGVDLLTRSLRYKMFTSSETGPQLQMPCLAWEIQALQTSHKHSQSREAAKELIKQQKGTIYMNIGAFASKHERNRLYSSWGIRKLTTGRLKKLVYELLWKDPKRYVQSAELVTQYL